MVYYVSFIGIKQNISMTKGKKSEKQKKKEWTIQKQKKQKQDKTKNEKRKKEKTNKQNKQKTTPNIYIVPEVGFKHFIFLPKIVCKER